MQNRISLKAEERVVLGKKVSRLRKQGIIPAHVFGNKIETEHVSVTLNDFSKVYKEAGETGLIDLKIGAEKVRPVLVRDVQKDPVRGFPLHVDFYQVNLLEKVKVSVPVVLIGDEPEIVHTGEAVVIQPISEVEVEALPAELPENIEVDIAPLRAIGDAIVVSNLKVPEGIEILADPEGVVVKLDNAVSAEAQELMEEMQQEQAAAAEAAEAAPEGGAEAPVEGEEGQAAVEGEEAKEESGGTDDQTEKPKEEKAP